MTEESVFAAARAIADPAARARFLDRACPDPAVRRDVEALLAADAASNPLDRPPADLAITGMYEPLVEQPGSRVGPYKLLQQIGEGGMGTVFMAEQEEPVRRRVALKIVKPGMDSRQVVARFEAERQALSMMDHPNIARVLDAGTTASGRPFFVMELVHGVPITDFCDANRLTPRDRLELFVPVCQAIQHAHMKGVIHRDIKPSNVLVTMYDDKPVPKVIDFGVAKAVEQRLTEKTLFTQFGTLVGTFEYMSPEQAEMNALGVDTRSDVYSLGVLLYELLTGTTPLERQRLRTAALGEVVRLIREEEPPKPSHRLSTGGTPEKVAAARKTEPGKLQSLVRGELDWIVMRSLEKDRTRRYETASGLAKDVERYLNGDAVEACPPTLGYRLRKVYRRNRAAVLVAGAFAGLVCAAAVMGTVLAVQARRAERDADEARGRAEQERDAAIAARRETFDALTDLTDDTVGDVFARKSAVGPADREFFSRVAERFERLAASMPDAAESEAMRARCLARVGDAYFYTGDYGRAVEAYRRAGDLYRGVRARSPDDPAPARVAIRCLANLEPSFERLGRLADSARAHDEALALAEDCHQRFPGDAEITCLLAGMYVNRANRRWEEPAARRADHDRAVVLATAGIERGGFPTARECLATALAARASYYGSLGDVEGARADAERVEKLRVGQNSLELDLAWCAATYALGVAFHSTNRPAAAAELYRRAAFHQEALAGQYPGEQHIRLELAKSYQGLTAALNETGHRDEADRVRRQAEALVERSPIGGPGATVVYVELANQAATQAAAASKAGRPGEAAEAVERAVKHARRAAEFGPRARPAETPKAREIHTVLANLYRAVAQAAEGVRRWPEAAEFAARQVEYARVAVEPGAPPTPEVFGLMIDGHRTLARAQLAAGHADEALASWAEAVRDAAWVEPRGVYDEACADLSRLAAKLAVAGKTADPAGVLAPGLAERRARFAADPAAAEVRVELRRGYRVVGLIAEKAGRFAAALEAFDRVVAVAPVPAEGPDERVKTERYLVFGALVGRSICLDALGREQEAENAWKAFYQFSRSGPANWAVIRAGNLARNGQPDRAIRLAEGQLVRRGAGQGLYDAACVYSLASADARLNPAQKEKYASRAVALLAEARAARFFTDPNQVANAKTDADLDPVRGRDDFGRALAVLLASPEHGPPPREVKH